jgi:hypothetical protein
MILSLKISKTATRWRNMLINCARGGGATPSLPSMQTTIQPSTPSPADAAGRAHRTTAAAAVPPGAQPSEDPRAVQGRQRHLLLPHHVRRTGEKVQAWLSVGPGKRVGRRELNTLGSGMIFLQDDDSKQQFIVDTGAVCSVLPHRANAQPASPQLSGADGRSIPTWGTIRCRLSFGLRTFFVTFFLATVYRPIQGLDFLSAHGLLVDPVSRQVLDSKTLKPLSKTPTAAGTLRSKFAATLCSITPSVRSLLASFPTIVGDGKGKPSPKHKIRHTIETTGRPVFAKARRLDPDKLRKAEAEFRELEAAGIIRRSDSPWSSPLHMVRKKDKSWRPCGDYRQLNLAMTHDRYPLPSILDLQQATRLQVLLLHRLGEGLPSDTDGGPGHRQNGDHHAVRFVRVPLYALRPPQRRPDLPALNGQPTQAPPLCVLLIGRHHHRQQQPGHRVDQDGVRPLQRHVQAISDFPPPPLRM